MVSQDFQKQLKGYGLTSAQIWYTLPDCPQLICPNWIFWQEYDLYPNFPALNRYLEHMKTLDGKPTIVKVAHTKLIKPAELRPVNGEFRLH